MLMNRNRLPKVSVFKNEDVLSSYVSKKETDGVITDISQRIETHIDTINDNFGFDYSRAPRECIINTSPNVFMRKPLLDVDGLIEREDASIASIPEIISFSRNNNVIGSISSSDTSPEAYTSMYTGMRSDKIYGKITYNIKDTSVDIYSYSPYKDLNMTDIVKSFTINNTIYSVYRGGYINIYNILTKISSTVNIVDSLPLFEKHNIKNDYYFKDYELCNCVTNVAYNGDSTIIISTTNNIIIFNIINKTYTILTDFLGKDEVVIALEMYNSTFYVITNSKNMSYRVRSYNISDGTIYRFDNEIENFFPNTIVKLNDGEVIAYESCVKFGKHILKRIAFMRLIENSTDNSISIDSPIDIECSFIFGNSINDLYIGLKSNLNFLNGSISVYDGSKLLFYPRNRSVIPDMYNNIEYIDNCFIISDYTSVYTIKFEDDKVVGYSCNNVSSNRNSGNYISSCTVLNDICTITHDDNTHELLQIEDLLKLSSELVYNVNTKKCICIYNENRYIVLNNTYMEIITDNDISTYEVIEYNSLYDQSEFDSIYCYKYFNNGLGSTFCAIVTRTASIIRFNMIKITNSGVISLQNITNYGWASPEFVDYNLIRTIDNKILFPVNASPTNSVILIVCDFDKNLILRTNINGGVYTKTLSFDISCRYMSIGIDSAVYLKDISEILHTTEEVYNASQTVESTIFTDLALDSIESTNVLSNFAHIDDDGDIDLDLLTLNCNRIISVSVPNYVKLSGKHIYFDSQYIKIYDNQYNLQKVIKNKFSIDYIMSIEHIFSNVYHIIGNRSSIYLNLSIIESDNFVPYINKGCSYVENNGVYAICDNGIISIINTVTNESKFDILNSLHGTNVNMRTDIYKLLLNTVDLYENHIITTVTVIYKSSGYIIGNFLLSIDPSGNVDITILTILNILTPEVGYNFIKTKFIDTAVKDGNLYISTYSNGKIMCHIMDNTCNIIEFIPIIYNVTTNTLFLRMIATSYGIHILLNGQNVFFSNYTSKVATAYIKPNDGNYYYVKDNNKSSFIIFKMNSSNIYYNHKNLSNGVINGKTTSITSNEIFRPYVISNFNNLSFSTNPQNNEVFIYNTYTNECIGIYMNKVEMFIDGYYSFDLHNDNYLLDNLFQNFSNSFVGFNSKSGLMRKLSNGYYLTTIGEYLSYSLGEISINYSINKYSCVRNNVFNRLSELNVVDTGLITSKIFDKNGNVKFLNCIIVNNRLIFTHSKYLNLDGQTIITYKAQSVSSESVSFERLQNNTSVIVTKKDNAIFGYKRVVFINSSNSSFTIDVDYPDMEIKPIFTDNSGLLHSIIRRNSIVFYFSGTNIYSATPIIGFSNVIDAINIDSIPNSLLLINGNNGAIVFNVISKTYKTINTVNDKVVGIPRDYIFERILELSTSLTCVILVKHRTNNTFHIIPDCSIDIIMGLDGEPEFEVDAANFGIIYSYSVNPITMNRFNSATINDSGVPLLDCIRTNNSSDYTVQMRINIGNITIDGNIIDDYNIYSYLYTGISGKRIAPRIFMNNSLFIVQYDKYILFYEMIDRYIPNFTPIYKIIQGNQSRLKIITDTMVSGNNVILTFSDKTCRTLFVKRIDRNGEIDAYIDDGFTKHNEYSASIDSTYKYFITENGTVGYYTDKSVYIHDGSIFVKIVTTENTISKACVDNLYGRIYCVDTYNNFGYIDIDRKLYIPVKALTDIIISNVVYTTYNSIELMTSKGIYSYINKQFYKISDKVVNDGEIIVYPLKSIT